MSVLGIQVGVLLSTILGGAITITGSLAVAFLYIRNQDKNRRRQLTHEQIQKTYFEGGIFPIIATLNDYGTANTFALIDIKRCLQWYYDDKNAILFEERLNEISTRSLIQDVLHHNFSSLSKYIPSCEKFGTVITVSIMQTAQYYSLIIKDAVTFPALQEIVAKTSIEEIQNFAIYMEESSRFLQKRFINLSDFLLGQEYESFDDFNRVLAGFKYKNFLTKMTQYLKQLTDAGQIMIGQSYQEKCAETLAFTKWLQENMEENPFDLDYDLTTKY